MEEQQYCNNHFSQKMLQEIHFQNIFLTGGTKMTNKKDIDKNETNVFVEEQNHHVVFSVKVVGQIYHGNVAEQETCSFFSSDIQVEISDDNEIPI